MKYISTIFTILITTNIGWSIDLHDYYYDHYTDGKPSVELHNIQDSLVHEGARDDWYWHPGNPQFSLPTQNFNPENAFFSTSKEWVDLASGNLMIIEPLVHYEGRNGLDLDILLTYNGGFWRYEGWPRASGYGTIPPITWQWCGLGWDICMGELKITIYRPSSNPQYWEHLPEYSSINVPGAGIKSRVIKGKLIGDAAIEYRVENNPDWRIVENSNGCIMISPSGVKYYYYRWMIMNRMWNGILWKMETRVHFLTKIEDSNGNYIDIQYADPNQNGYLGAQICHEDYWNQSDIYYANARLPYRVYDTKGDYAKFYYHDEYIVHQSWMWWHPVLDSIRYKVGFNTYPGGPTWNSLRFEYDLGIDLSEASDPFDGKCNLLTKIEYRNTGGTQLKPPKQFGYDIQFGNINVIVYPTAKTQNGTSGGYRKFGYNEVFSDGAAGMSYRRISYVKEHPWATPPFVNRVEYYFGPGQYGQPWDNNYIRYSTIGEDRTKDGDYYVLPSYRRTKVLYTETGNYDVHYFLDEDRFSNDFHKREPMWGTCWKIEHYNSSNQLISKEEYGYDLTKQGQSMIGSSSWPWPYKQLRGELHEKGGSKVFTEYKANDYTKYNQWKQRIEWGYIAILDWGDDFTIQYFQDRSGDERRTEREFLWETNSNYINGTVFLIDKVQQLNLYDDDNSSNIVSQVQYEYDTPGYVIYDYAGHPPSHHSTQTAYRGNLTKFRHGLDEAGSWHWITTHYKYDICGNVVRTINPLGDEVSYRYDESFPAIVPNVPAVYQYALLRKIAKYVDNDSVCEGANWYSAQGLIKNYYDPNSPSAEEHHSTRYRYWMLNDLRDVTAFSDNPNNFSYKCYRKFYYKYGVLNYQYNHGYIYLNKDDNYDPNNSANRYTDQYYIYDYLGKLFQYHCVSPYSNDSTWTVNHYYNEKGITDTLSKQFSSVKGQYIQWPSPGSMVNGYTKTLHDAIGRDTSVTHPPGTNEQDRIHYSYNDYNIGNEVTITDENNNQRKYTYDAYGRLSKVEMIPNNSEYTTEYQYNALGNLTQASKKNGQYIMTYIYDSMGRLIQKHDPNSGTTKYIYDDVGNLRFIQDANHAAEGNWVYNKYDDVNRLIEDGEIYDVNPTRADANNQNYPTNGSWRVKRYYDYSYNGSTNPRGNLVRELISQDGVSCEYMSVYSYDKRGRITSKTVYKSDSPIRGLTISYEYDAQDNLIRITYPDGEQTVYNYNGLMLCDTVKTLGGLIIGKIHYDENEKPDSIIMGDLGSTAYTYYARDWLENIYVKHGNEENSVIRNYFYDNVGNTTYEHREASTSVYTLGYNYNVSYSYDNLYRLTNENYSGSINKQISYSYDYLHNRKQITEDGITIPYMYYKNTSLLAGVGGIRYLNDKNGNLTHCSLYSNTYDYCNELIERRGKKTTTYSYDGKGNRVRQETIGGKGSYRFYIRDESGRVIFETDDTPNVLKNPHFENGDNWSPWLTYTPGGSCTWQVAWDQRKSGYRSIKGTSKTDNWETFIQKVQLADCPIPFVISVYIKTQDLTNGINLQVDFYDGITWLGNKQSGLVTGTNNWVQVILPVSNDEVPNGTDRMDIFVRKFAGTGTVWIDCFRVEGGAVPTPNESKYIYVSNIHLARINWSDYIPFFYFCDALGTPMKISKVLGEYPDKNETFKAFGEQLTSSGSVSNTHRFTGKEYEASGIYYFGARYYDPTLGRFLTPDPLGKFELRDPRTINPYVYCTNNPLFYVDPDGRVRWRVVRIGALNVVTGGLAAVGGGLAVTAGVATTPIGGIGALKIVGGLAAIGWGTMEFGQGITNLTLGFADQEPINIPETIAGSIAGKKGVVAVKVGKLTLGLTTPTAGGVVSNEAVKMIIKAIEAGSTIQEINELGEELGIDIESSFENLPPIEPMKDPMEKIREEMGRKKEFD